MKRHVLHAVLTAVAIVGGVALARVGAPSVAAADSAPVERTRIPWAGLTCPKGDMISTVSTDFYEGHPTATPQQVIAKAVHGYAPELAFDRRARRDVDPSHGRAEFALRDADGHVVARFRAVRLDRRQWVPEGWTACASVGGHDTPDPEPSVVSSAEPAAPLPQHTEANEDTDKQSTNDPGTGGTSSSINEALAAISGNVDIPVVLPDGMPRDVRLADRHPIYRPAKGDPHRTWTLHLVYGPHDHVLLISFGEVPFDGCDVPPARGVRISGTPGLLALSRKHRRVIWSQLIWPANHAHPVGRYGLSGTLPPRQLVEMARTVPQVQPLWMMPGGC